MNHLFRLIWTLIISGFRPKCDLIGPCKTPFLVLPTDLDVLLHVNNGVYFSLLDLARVDLMIRSGLFHKLRQGKFYPVVAAETIQFHKSLKLFEKFEVETTILGWDEKYFYAQHRFIKADRAVAVAIVAARFIKKGKGPVSPSEIVALGNPELVSPNIPEWILQWCKDIIETRER